MPEVDTGDKDLGRVLKAWLYVNGWSIKMPQKWSKAYGFNDGPHASQLSYLINGKLAPRPDFFKSLGRFNEAISKGDVDKIVDVKSRKLFQAADALCWESGQPYDAMDFFGLYLGVTEVPKMLEEVIELQAEAAAA